MAREFRKPVVYVLSSFKDLVSTLTKACSSAEFLGINKEDVSLETMQDAEIIVADTVWISSWIFQLPKLKWVQSTFAGVDKYSQSIPRDLSRPSFMLTKNGGYFGPLLAEYVIGHVIARERKFHFSWEGQKIKKWVPFEEMYFRCLSELTIGVVGFGEIGQEIAKYCKAMKMTVNSVQRDTTTPRLAFVDNVFSVQNLSECLKQCDYVCNVLPSTAATRGFFSGSVLENCKEKKTVFINIGRGDAIDEGSILKALDNGWIGGAILDVYEVEPLPDSSPLWGHPKVTITPHVGGLTSAKEVSELFCANFEAYQSGKPLKYTVDWSKGY